MNTLHVSNAHFITFRGELLTIDVLGGVDLSQVERLVCTLRITNGNFPPFRTTLDLYNDNQTDKLTRTLCDKWELKLVEVSKSLYNLTLQLEEYRLEQLRYGGKLKAKEFEPNEEDRKKAIQFLKNKNLLPELIKSLNTTGIYRCFALQNQASAKVIFCKNLASVCPMVLIVFIRKYRQTPFITSIATIYKTKPCWLKI